MTWIAFFVVMATLWIVFQAAIKHRLGSVPKYPYRIQALLFTPAESHFLRALEQAVGSRCRIFGKVRVADVLEVQQGLNRAAQASAFNRISAKHFDFVLCNPDDFSIIGVIELNDSSHQQKNRSIRDAFLITACEAAKLPILMVPARRSYSVENLRAEIEAGIFRDRAGRTEPHISNIKQSLS